MILSRSFRGCWSSYGFKNEVAMDPLNVLSSWYILSNFVFFLLEQTQERKKLVCWFLQKLIAFLSIRILTVGTPLYNLVRHGMG